MELDLIYEKYDKYEEILKKYNQVIMANKNNYNILLRTMDKIYKFLKSVAPIFYETDDCIDLSAFFGTLATMVRNIESHIPDSHFIIASEPDFIYRKNKPSKPHTNNPEIILDWLVYMARERYAYTSFWTKKASIEGLSFQDECVDMCKNIKFICDENNIECIIKRINPGFLDTARLCNGTNYHDICIVTLNGFRFLVDCTYRQFFMLKWNSLERIGVPFLSTTKPGTFMIMNDERLNVANTILKRGWIVLTPENIKNYFDGFAISFRNGLYYKETGDYSYTTNYNAHNYEDFLEGQDNQVNHEGKLVLGRQLKISK